MLHRRLYLFCKAQFITATLNKVIHLQLIAPFIVMIICSFLTTKNKKESLDRFYVKMKTPVLPEPEDDAEELKKSYDNPDRFDHRKLIPNSNLEFQKPTVVDIVGFVISLAVCFGVIYLAILVAGIGA